MEQAIQNKIEQETRIIVSTKYELKYNFQFLIIPNQHPITTLKGKIKEKERHNFKLSELDYGYTKVRKMC